MSLFLAPIHTWLFNKIVLVEDIEKAIVERFNSDEAQQYYVSLVENMGAPLPDLPLENLIDTGNIHGWLQGRITLAETRQAAFIRYILQKDDRQDEAIQAIYHDFGVRSAKLLEEKPEVPVTAFDALNNVLLEGMPCDRVNSVVTKDANEIVWKTTNCVHKGNWEASGVDVNFFYGYRAAFIQGFVTTANPEFTYSYANDVEQVHQIVRN